MKQFYNANVWRTIVVALALIGLPAMTETAQADNVYLQKADYHDAYSSGNGKIHIKQLIFGQGSSHNYFAGVGGTCVGDESDKGKVVDGSNSYYRDLTTQQNVTIIEFEADNSKNKPGSVSGRPKDKGWVRFKVISGVIQVTNDYAGSKPSFIADGIWHEVDLKRLDSGDHLTYFEYDWFPPESLDNKRFELYSGITRHRSSETKPWSRCVFLLGTFEGADPDMAPILSEPFFYPANENGAAGYGALAMVYNNIQNTYRYYTSENDAQLPCPDNSGMMYIDARDTVIPGFRVCFESVRSSDNVTKHWVWSNRVDVPAYHKIHDFEVNSYTYYRDDIDKYYADYRYKKLTWKIYYPQQNDIMDGDLFEIQRAYSADFSDAETIETISMEYDSLLSDTLSGYEIQTYTYVDSTEAAWWNPVLNDYTIYYRIRRVSSASWGWEEHEYASSVSFTPNQTYYVISLAGSTESHTFRKDADFDNNHQVHLQLSLRNLNTYPQRTKNQPGGNQGYWDDKQKLILHKILVELNDTIDIEIPKDSVLRAIDRIFYSTDDNEYFNNNIVVNYTDVANTPCVHYNYMVSIDTTDVVVKNVLLYTDKRQVRGTDDIYYTEAANINTFSGSHEEYSDNVLLTWDATEGNVGTYTVETRPNDAAPWDTLATGLTDTWLRDTHADPSVSLQWQYRLTMTYECNGNSTSSTAQTTGARSPYGKVSGHVHYEDGIGCADIEVLAMRENDGEVVQRVRTDESGAYLLDSLLYGTGMKYTIMPVSQSAEFRYNNTSSGSASLGLGLDDCIAENIDFDNISAVRFSGRVLYENTTIPARDVNFLVNGKLVKTGANAYKTDAAGNFEFNVPSRAGFTLQAVKDGHVFAGDGFVRIDGDSVLSLTKPLDGVRIYDATKVRLIGRLTGGNNQASKPLGFGLSQNNLGDDLKLVLELEGDNISQIVRIPDDPTKDTLELAFGDTKMHLSRKRIIIEPDPVTGEYAVDIFPVKYKITQATARGYATLFAEGKTGETLDLTVAPAQHKTSEYEGQQVEYNESYCITYHSPISISCVQLLYGAELPYLGEKSMRRQNIANEMVDVPLVEKQADGTYRYLFGAPVFKTADYQFRVTAHEDYYYNNDPNTPKHEEVRIKGGTLKVYNGMHDAENTIVETKQLDSDGQALITVPIDYVSFLKTGENALRVLDLSVEHEGAYVEHQALRAYITGNRAKGQDFLTSTHGKVEILDILRDPPGSKSYAYIETGTTYKYSYTYNFSFKFGLKIDLAYGTHSNNSLGIYAGSPVGGTYSGYNFTIDNKIPLSLPIQTSYFYKRSAYYTFTTTDRIETGSDTYYVGENGDVYIGLVQNMYMGVTDAVKPIDSLTYATLYHLNAQGSMPVVAEGTANDGKKYYLVIGRETEVGPYVASTFTYTHDYIVNTLIPKLCNERNSLLMMGDSTTIQTMANQQGKALYWSLVAPEHEHFGEEGYYRMIVPENSEKQFADEVYAYDRLILDWIDVLISNEREKINAIYGQNAEEVGTWSVSGGTKVTHTESYDYGNTYTSRIDYPGFSLGTSSYKSLKSSIEGMNTPNAVFINKLWDKYLNKVDDEGTQHTDPQELLIDALNYKFSFDFTPILDFNFDRDPNHSESHNKKAGFVLQPDTYGYMDVSVRRVVNKKTGYNKDSDGTREFVDNGWDYDEDDYLYGSYVYYLNAGASRCPWEKADSTKFYTPSMPLSAGTLNLENQRLDIDVHERSNVPIDQPAIFNLRMTNEGDNPYVGGAAPITFYLKQEEGSNPMGAKLMVDGLPLTGDGRAIKLKHGQIINKTLEVYAGEGYDFENIVLNLASPCDQYNKAACTFSVHYMPVSCPVNISAPHDKWVLNTLSPQDSIGWYLPVVIDGFDVNYRGFDHIEFQYKLSTQSDDAWVNQCSFYYDDSLYNAASGNKALITSGRIENIRFYGERDPMEQNYDLRAVSFCRHGSGFISRSSAVLTGMKDTRPPRVFGDPQPVDAVLGVGDNLLLRFNEAIAGNYLDEDNNFQILGTTNSIGLTAGTAVHFDGSDDSYAYSQVSRNLTDKSFTIDLIVKPTNQNTEEHFFTHGEDGKSMVFGKNAENRLFIELTGTRIYSLPIDPMLEFTRVAVTFDYDSFDFRFYAGTQDVTDYSKLLPPYTFSSEGSVIWGRGFNGSMMEARLWTKALSPAEIVSTNLKRLTGYEFKLLDYYPMNEGRGNTITDKANGATLTMNGAEWDIRQGASMRFSDDEANVSLLLNSDVLSRSAIQDFTLMFWFKTKMYNCNIFRAGRSDDKNGTWIGTEQGTMKLRNDSSEWLIGNYSDGGWHHFVLSVNRTFNNASIYIDGNLTNSFAATEMGAMNGTMLLGGEFMGSIDEFILFEQAMPKTIITAYDNISPNGDEMGIIAYLPFSEEKENANGIVETVYSGNDQRIIKDSQGNVVNKIVQLVTGSVLNDGSESDPSVLFDKTDYPPVRQHEHLVKLKFDWAFNNDELLINITMPEKEINKQTLYVTVRDVEDINGNPMASPVMWAAYVDKNSLKWEDKEINVHAYTDDTDKGNYGTYAATITNLSGLYHQYNIEGLPAWLTTDEPFGTIEPLGIKTLLFKYKLDMPAGSYSEIIYLTDENGLSEPIRFNYRVETLCPWDQVDNGKFDQSMSLRAQVFFLNEDGEGGVYDTDENDIISVFCEGELVGMTKNNFDNLTNKAYVYLTINGNADMKNKVLSFKLWQASTGKVFRLTSPTTLRFSSNSIKGYSPDAPVLLTVNPTASHQQINMQKGWNWISWNIRPTKSSPDANLSYEQGFRNGDVAKSPSERLFSVFAETDTLVGWYGTLASMSYHHMYLVRTSDNLELTVEGKTLTDEQRYVTLAKGWNSISFLMDEVTPLKEALADYYEKATVGDVIKSKSEVAVFTENGKWEGSLQVLRPGQGYMFRRLASGSVKMFYYPSGISNAPKKAETGKDTILSDETTFNNPDAATNMTMIAKVVESQKSKAGSIRAYVGNELAAVAEPIIIDNDTLYFLTIQSDNQGQLRFETGDGTPLSAASSLDYSSDAHHGSLHAPVLLTFAQDDSLKVQKRVIDGILYIFMTDGRVYNAQGILVDNPLSN